MNTDWLTKIWEFAERVEPVGSRVTCNPVPTDTDMDVLILTRGAVQAEMLRTTLASCLWTIGGSEIAEEANNIPAEQRFLSYKRGDVNLIITESREFFRRFMAASSVCKRLNLLAKPDRIALFQAVLYGNACPAPTADADLSCFA